MAREKNFWPQINFAVAFVPDNLHCDCECLKRLIEFPSSSSFVRICVNICGPADWKFTRLERRDA
jgi:hypothetical protein